MNWKLGLALTLLLSPALLTSSVSGGSLGSGFDDADDAANGEDLDEEDEALAWNNGGPNSIYEDEDTLPPSWLNSEELLGDLDTYNGNEGVLNSLVDGGGSSEDDDVIASPMQKRSQLTWFPSRNPLDSLKSFFQARVSRSSGGGGRYFSANEYVKRRLCIPPTMSCNLRPNSCCSNTTCRCNLWGQNCRCLRMGFFQRWGKKK